MKELNKYEPYFYIVLSGLALIFAIWEFYILAISAEFLLVAFIVLFHYKRHKA